MSHARSLARSSIASLVATGFEYILLSVLVRPLHVPRWIGFASVQFFANLITFLLYKYWAFEARYIGALHRQYGKQLVIFSGSLTLNTVFPSLMSYRGHLPPELAFGISNLFVYLVWNYPGNRYWVFKKSELPPL